METDPVKEVKVSAPFAVDIVDIEPVSMSQAVPVPVVTAEPVKPVQISVVSMPEVIEMRPGVRQTAKIEAVVVDRPVAAEEVHLGHPEVKIDLVSEDPISPVSEAELHRKDIGKVAEKLVTKAKIKKLKTKKAVLRKSSESADESTGVDDGKEKLTGDPASGPKARKRPLQDATSDWTTEGQAKLLLRCCLTVLLAFTIASLAYYLIH
jgi:hypothetical protein